MSGWRIWIPGALITSVAWAVDSGLAHGHHGDFAGMAIKGKLAGSQLRQLPATMAFWFAWRGFYPETRLWRASR